MEKTPVVIKGTQHVHGLSRQALVLAVSQRYSAIPTRNNPKGPRLPLTAPTPAEPAAPSLPTPPLSSSVWMSTPTPFILFSVAQQEEEENKGLPLTSH